MESRLGAEQLETRKVLASSATFAPYAPSGVTVSGVNAAEELAGFTIRVPFGTSGAGAGESLSLTSGATTLGTVVLEEVDTLANKYHDFRVESGQLGADGLKSVTAEIDGFVSPALTFLLDTTKPTVTVASSVASLGIGQTANITFTLSEASITFDGSDLLSKVTAAGGTLSGFNQVSATVYTAIFTPAASSTVPGNVSVPAWTFSDDAANFNVGGGLAVPIIIDTVAPTVTIASSHATLGGSQTATITFTLSKDSTTFALADINVSGGTIDNFVQSSLQVYTATFTPAPNSTANGTISVPAGAFRDAVGNTNTDGVLSTPIDINTVSPAAPTFALANDTGSSNSDGVTNDGTVNVSSLVVG